MPVRPTSLIIEAVAPRRTIAILFVTALVAAACSRSIATSPTPKVLAPSAPPAPPVTSVQNQASGPGPVLPRGTFVARSKTPDLTIWKGPSTAAGRRFSFPDRNAFGQPIAFLVTSTARDADGGAWLRILLPIRPNDAAGWVRRGAVQVHAIHQHIVVDLSSRVLRYYRDGKLVDHFRVGVGRPETPTAVGTFYVWAQVPQASPSGPYGVFALGLSGFSPVLLDWPGGGRMAIHGTAFAADQGQMVSHGCVRVYNPNMQLLEGVPLGTPVTIHI